MRITGRLYVEVNITDVHGNELSFGKYYEKYGHIDPSIRLYRSDPDNEKYRNERDIYLLPELIEKEILHLFESNLLEYDPEQHGSFEYDPDEEGAIQINLKDFSLHAIKNIYDRKFNAVIEGRNVSIWFAEIADPEITPEPEGEFGYDDGKNDMFNFMEAVLSGNLEVIDRIIASGEIDINNPVPISTLHYAERAIQTATLYEQIEVIRRLIAAGADINIGSPPSLCIAVENNNLDIFNLLIEAGADISANCSTSVWSNKSILAHAAELGHDAMVHRCIELGLDVDKDEPIYLACTHISEARYANYVNTIRLLIKAGANVDTTYSPLVNPIIEHGYIDIIRLLVPHIHKQEFLDNALFDAVLAGRNVGNVAPFPEIVNLLLQQGANPGAPNHTYRGAGRPILALVNKATQRQLLLGTNRMNNEDIIRAAQRLGFTAAEIAELLRQRAASRRGHALKLWGKHQAEMMAEEEGNNNQGGGRRTRHRRHNRRQRKLTRARSRK